MAKVLVDSGWYQEVFNRLSDLSQADTTALTAWNAVNFAKAAIAMSDEPDGKIFVVWDRLHEKVISVHTSEAGASQRANDLNEKRHKEQGGDGCYDFEYDEFEVEP